jgi:hypothetical protein
VFILLNHEMKHDFAYLPMLIWCSSSIGEVPCDLEISWTLGSKKFIKVVDSDTKETDQNVFFLER